MDSIILSHQSEYNVTGATYAIVKGEKLLAMNHIGLADLENKLPMDAEHTTFMLGSLSKLVVATAVMQMVERGQLNLDTDVNDYLKTIEVPAVSLRQLLTHTAGFEERTFARLRLEEKDFISLNDYLSKRMPNQIFPAGKVAAYSNHGVALAGLVVEEISGLSFEEFVQQNIFGPLDMQNSTFILNEQSKTRLAKPYQIQKGQAIPTHFEYVQTIPASMLIGSARDMAHFMMAHVNGGTLNGKQILKKETIDTLQKRHFSGHPSIYGRALGFFEREFRGMRGLTHGNNRNGFISYIHLIPEDSLGVFVTINGGQSAFRNIVINEFFRMIYPVKEKPSPSFQKLGNARKFAGTYLRTRRNDTSIERIFYQVVLGNEVKVKALKDTALFLFNEPYKVVEPGLLGNPAGSFHVAFSKINGVPTLHLPGRADAFQKVSWYGQKGFTFFSLGLSTLTFIIILIGGLIRLFFKKKRKEASPFKYWRAFAGSGLLFIVTFFGSIAIIGANIQYGIPTFFYLIFLLPILSIIFFVIAGLGSLKAWMDLGKMGRVKHGLLIAIGLIFVWQLYYWNFIGFSF